MRPYHTSSVREVVPPKVSEPKPQEDGLSEGTAPTDDEFESGPRLASVPG